MFNAIVAGELASLPLIVFTFGLALLPALSVGMVASIKYMKMRARAQRELATKLDTLNGRWGARGVHWALFEPAGVPGHRVPYIVVTSKTQLPLM